MLILGVFKHALMITSFVLMMMLLIEYINVQTRGEWQKGFQKNRFRQYLLAATLGVLPGCLGAFTVVSLYSHRIVSFGALVGVMIATSGDEAFVMLSMFPQTAIWLNVGLFFLAILVAFGVDILFKGERWRVSSEEHQFEVHEQEYCHCFSKHVILNQLKHITFVRTLLLSIFGLFLVAQFSSIIGPDIWNWKKITFVIGSTISIFIITTVPDHFLEEHIYKHIIKKHLLRVFLWTLSALLFVHYIENYFDITEWIKENEVILLFISSLLGIIPESGPHMVFVTMYANGLVPFAVLLASSISQDGHGTLPLLAVSMRTFLLLKIINVFVALILGLMVLSIF